MLLPLRSGRPAGAELCYDPRGRHLFQRVLSTGHAGRAAFVRLSGAATRSAHSSRLPLLARLSTPYRCWAALRRSGRRPFRIRARSCGFTRSRYCSIVIGAPSAYEAYSCRLASRCARGDSCPLRFYRLRLEGNAQFCRDSHLRTLSFESEAGGPRAQTQKLRVG